MRAGIQGVLQGKTVLGSVRALGCSLAFISALADASPHDPDVGNFNFGQPVGYTAKEFEMKLFELPRGVKTGFRFRTEASPPDIPDLGGPASVFNLDADALAYDLTKRSETVPVNVKSVRSNWLSYANENYRFDLIQSPTKSGIRFHHLVTGLRFEAERKLLTGNSSVFVGVRLVEDKRYEPTAGCTYTQQRSESRSFCGLRLRVGL